MRKVVVVLGVCLVLALLGLGATVWLGSSVVMKPPWYSPRSPEEGLRVFTEADTFAMDGWQGIFADPGQDFGYAFESVEFPAEDGRTKAARPRPMKHAPIAGTHRTEKAPPVTTPVP